MVYNASIEQEIHNLIKNSSEGNLEERGDCIEKARYILDKEFAAFHPGDLPEHDVERFRIRKKFYGLIIKAYDDLFKDFIGTDYERGLAENSELQINLSESDAHLENIKKENERLEETVEDLSSKVEDLSSKVAQHEESRRVLKTT